MIENFEQLTVGADLVLSVCYAWIAITLIYLIARVRNLPFRHAYIGLTILLTFGSLAFAVEALDAWVSLGVLVPIMRGVAACAALVSALTLPSVIPRARALASGTAAANAHAIRLEHAYEELSEVVERYKRLSQEDVLASQTKTAKPPTTAEL